MLGAGARGPQDEKGLTPPAAQFKLDSFAFGDEFVAVRAPDFRQFFLVHDGKSVAPRRLSAYPALRLARDTRQADTPHGTDFPVWGRGAASLRRAGGGVAAPPPLSVSLSQGHVFSLPVHGFQRFHQRGGVFPAHARAVVSFQPYPPAGGAAVLRPDVPARRGGQPPADAGQPVSRAQQAAQALVVPGLAQMGQPVPRHEPPAAPEAGLVKDAGISLDAAAVMRPSGKGPHVEPSRLPPSF